MSLQTPAIVTCNACEHQQDIMVHNSVNVTADPSLKTKVMNWSLYDDVICKNCGKKIPIQAGLLYHDMAQRLVIRYRLPEEPANTDEATLFDEFLKEGYIVRAVDDFFLLREKITIFDAGLNDEVIDELKREIAGTLDDNDIELYLFFVKYNKGLFKKTLDFHLFSNPAQIMAMSFPVKKLSEARKALLFNQDVLRGKMPDGF